MKKRLTVKISKEPKYLYYATIDMMKAAGWRPIYREDKDYQLFIEQTFEKDEEPTPPNTDYAIVSSSSISGLTRFVNTYIECGYKLIGGVSRTEDKEYIQAMIKE